MGPSSTRLASGCTRRGTFGARFGHPNWTGAAWSRGAEGAAAATVVTHERPSDLGCFWERRDTSSVAMVGGSDICS